MQVGVRLIGIGAELDNESCNDYPFVLDKSVIFFFLSHCSPVLCYRKRTECWEETGNYQHSTLGNFHQITVSSKTKTSHNNTNVAHSLTSPQNESKFIFLASHLHVKLRMVLRSIKVFHAWKFNAFLKSNTSKRNKTNAKRERDACKINYRLPSV